LVKSLRKASARQSSTRKDSSHGLSTLGSCEVNYAERKKVFQTSSGLTVEKVYTPTHRVGADYLKDLGFPGEFPFTRGIYPTMYRARLWTMRQYGGFGTAKETNRRYRFLLEQGQTGLSVAFDYPTQMGYDSDHQLADGEVGRVGVAVASVQDMQTLFAGIPLDKVSVSMTINAPAAILLGMYIAVAEASGVPQAELAGTVQNDILKEYIARGMYIFPPEPSMRLATDIFEYCSEKMPRWNTISISGYHIREAGATAAQELAFTLANGITYVESAQERGLDVDKFASRLSFFFCAHNDFFEEIAKFRAARRLWAKIMKERFHPKRTESLQLRFHTQTSGVALTAEQPENNIIRVALQALAAVLGGTQSLHTNSMDESLALPSEAAVKIALRTQQIIAEESGVANTVDSVGGSYYVENLTDQIEGKAEEMIRKIDNLGGMLSAIEKGYVQKEIAESSYRHQREVESGERPVVGVNVFSTRRRKHIETLRINPELERKQVASLLRFKQSRDNALVGKTLDGVKASACNEVNLMPSLLHAVTANATLGEICDVLREVFGEYRAPQVF